MDGTGFFQGLWARAVEQRVLLVWAALASVGCTSAFDVIGNEESVFERRGQKTSALSEKSPKYDPERTIEENFDGCTMTLSGTD